MRFLSGLCLMLLVLCLPVTTAFAAKATPGQVVPGKTVQDLPYGEVLFHFYKQDYFTSLVHLLITEEKERVPNHIEDSELLSGGLYLSYGMPDIAENIFKKLLTEQQSADVKNRAWYYLGKIAYQRSDPVAAVSWLEKITGELPGELQGRNNLMYGLIAMQQEDYATAITQFNAWEGTDKLAPFVAYNLGVAELKTGKEEEGIERLDSLAGEKFRRDNDSLLALKDKANITIGFYLLGKNEPAEARTYINRVRLNGPLSNQALLGAGWTDVEQDSDLSALVPWQALSERNVLDPLVQETLLAIPLALSKAGATGQAAEAYERAVVTFSDEIRRLDQAMENIQTGEFIEYLVSQEEKVELGWMRDLKVSAAAPEPFYLDNLLSSHRVQESLKNYRDLWFLKNNLENWQKSFGAFDDMLSLRRERFEMFVPQAKEKLERLGLEGYERQYQQLSDFYGQSVTSESWLDFATSKEIQQWELLEAIQAQLNAQSDMENHQELQDKVDFYRGIILWQLNAAQPDRRWKIKKQLGIVGDELARTRTFVDSISSVMLDLPKGFEGFNLRIQEDKEVITRQQLDIEKTMTRQADVLITQVLEILQEHRDRLELFNLKAGFALAQIYDRAANPEVEQK